MRKIVLASNNTGKIRELQSLLAAREFEVLPQQDFGIADVEETGKTFVENALLKARHAAEITGLPAIADDSGLCVDALQGAPGIYSARYAGIGQGSAANIQKLLANLKEVPEEKRDAFFYCCLVYVKHADDPTPVICEGRWEGRILMAVRGNGGFGYDPVFLVPSENKSAAELTAGRKNEISHRARALRALVDRL